MRYLFFDTETTGFPPNCRIVELAAILYDDKLKRDLYSFGMIATNDDIPENTTDIHGITTDLSKEIGSNPWQLLHFFTTLTDISDCLVSFNIKFDRNVIYNELEMIQSKRKRQIIRRTKSICLMQAGKKLFNGKYPKLEDLYFKLFEHKMKDAHTAMGDARACKEIFLKLKELGYV